MGFSYLHLQFGMAVNVWAVLNVIMPMVHPTGLLNTKRAQFSARIIRHGKPNEVYILKEEADFVLLV